MKHKKKLGLSNKLFLIGLGILSTVGVVSAALPHIMHITGTFDNIFQVMAYSVWTKNMVVDAEAAAAEKDKEINADVIIENAGDIPVFARISYFNLPANKVFTGSTDCGAIDRDALINETNMMGGNLGGDSEKDIVDEDGTKVSYGSTTDEYTKAKWKIKFLNPDKFEYYRGDGCYYYKGILTTGEAIQHLKSVTLTSDVDSSTKEQTFYKTGEYDSTDWISGTAPSGTTESGIKKVVTFGSSDPLKLNLVVLVETIQATDADFNIIEKLSDDPPTASTMQAYWEALLPSQPIN